MRGHHLRPTDAADHRVDISDAAVNAAFAKIGSVDFLINSAGIVGPNEVLWKLNPTEWRRTFDVNVNGLFNVTRAVILGMIDSGWERIVSRSSMAGKEKIPKLSACSGSKAAGHWSHEATP